MLPGLMWMMAFAPWWMMVGPVAQSGRAVRHDEEEEEE